MEPHVLEHILDGREEPTNLPFALLKNITDNFSKEREIGHGGFATVYKGVLPIGNVAVKRIRNSHTIDEKLFYREVNSLLTISHPNIVRFLGFCASTDQTAIKIEGSKEHIYAEIRERLLCFEFLRKGNLQKHITDELRGLDWCTRYQVIKGICDGLHYLHMEAHIYHMDLKPANILLNNDMVPKITDFGLSRLDEKSQTMSVDRSGSLGYCAPEYLRHGKMSFKSDIYSLGIIITELVTGKKSISNDNRNNVLRRWRHRWRKTGMASPLGYQQVTKCINIGLRCQEIDPCNRPFIWEIVRDINEMEGTDSQTSINNDSTASQISPYMEDDMLGIEPLEIHFPFELNKELSCLVQLTNDTDSHIAFEVQKMSPLPYCTEPHQGIVPPRSKCGVDITLQPQYKAPQRANEFIVRSTKVNFDLTTEHINTAMFNNYTGNVVDEVNLDVVFDPEVTAGSSVILDVNPVELLFNFKSWKLNPCFLYLTNNSDEDVTFGLMEKSNDQTCFISSLPMYAIVAPRTTYTLVLTTNVYADLPEKDNCVDLILHSSTAYRYLGSAVNEHFGNAGNSFVEDVDKYFQNSEALGYDVHKVNLKAHCSNFGKTTFEKSIPPFIKIISMDSMTRSGGIFSIDANQTEPLIIIGREDGYIHVSNSDTQKFVGSVNMQNRHILKLPPSVKFIASKGWFLVGSEDGFIHVYNYKKDMQKITSFKAHVGSGCVSLAIHPTQPYVLSASLTEIKLWDWDRWFGWKCIQTFKEHSDVVCAIAFNPEDYNSFASSSCDCTIKVWNLDSPESKYTLHGLTRHSRWVTFLEFFTRDGQNYLITGTGDKTAKIWDMKNKECVCTLPHRSEVRSVLPHPKLALLVTGTVGGDLYFWSSTNFRLKRVLNLCMRSEVHGLACLIESGRVVVAQQKRFSVIEIHDEEEQVASEGNDENSISATDHGIQNILHERS